MTSSPLPALALCSRPERLCVLPGLDPTHYERSPLHALSAIWPEKNCYVDFWIEVLHAKGQEPEAMLPFVIACDFDGDQWTFFKPSHDELWSLYGIKVQEMTVWRPWLEHATEHLSAGRLMSYEVDAFHLPDTAGTDYREKHSKTTIVVNDLDTPAKRLGYFHNAGYHGLSGEDFDAVFGLSGPPPSIAHLPFFAELISWPAEGHAVPTPQLRTASLQLMRAHLARVPLTNPIARFADRIALDLPTIQQQGLAYYHAWAFASTRQLGAAFELAACWVEWMEPTALAAGAAAATNDGRQALAAQAARAFRSISTDAKGLILKGARAVANHRALDAHAQLASAIQQWDEGMRALRAWVA